MSTANLTPSLQLYVNNTTATTAYFSDKRLVIGQPSAASPFTAPAPIGVNRIWTKFDLSSIPAGSTINSATLVMRNFYSNHVAYNYLLFDLAVCSDNTWSNTTTWNTAPNASVGSTIASFDTTPAGTFGYDAPFTGLASVVSSALVGGKISFRIKCDDEGIGFLGSFDVFQDSDHSSATYPQLQINYTALATTGNFFLMF